MRIQWNKVTWYSWTLAVIVFVGIFFWAGWLGKELREISIYSSMSKTADWKIYVNEKYGWSMKYPSDWKFTIIGNAEPKDADGPVFQGPDNCYENGERCGSIQIDLAAYPDSSTDKKIKESNMSVEDYLNYDHVGDATVFPEIALLQKNKVNFNSISAYQLVTYTKNLYGAKVEKTIYFKKGDSIFMINIREEGKDDTAIKDITDWKLNDLYNLILSTFKFTN